MGVAFYSADYTSMFHCPYELSRWRMFCSTYPGSRLEVSRPLGVCWSLESILIISMVMMKKVMMQALAWLYSI